MEISVCVDYTMVLLTKREMWSELFNSNISSFKKKQHKAA